MDYIAVLDYEHLDNGLFLSAFAKAVSNHKKRGIIIHGESKYTERLIQTGIMREEATIRAIKDLNHRLVALFADEGVSTIGLNGYQRSLIKERNGSIDVDVEQFHKFPEHPTLLVSSLIDSDGHDQPKPMGIAAMAYALKNELNIDDVIIFSTAEGGDIIKQDLPKTISRTSPSDSTFLEKQVPKDFRDIEYEVKLTTAQNFSNYPDLTHATIIS
ncbi:MAG: hypothetical protein WD381_04960, partial [Balneolaceae bacterium]